MAWDGRRTCPVHSSGSQARSVVSIILLSSLSGIQLQQVLFVRKLTLKFSQWIQMKLACLTLGVIEPYLLLAMYEMCVRFRAVPVYIAAVAPSSDYSRSLDGLGWHSQFLDRTVYSLWRDFSSRLENLIENRYWNYWRILWISTEIQCEYYFTLDLVFISR